MQVSVEPVWEERSDQLDFRFGGYVVWRVPLRALSLQSNPFVVSPDLPVPLDEAVKKGYRATVKYGTLIGADFPAIRIDNGSLRYVARYGERYVVDLSGSFGEYLYKFSNKSRNTLKRKVKKISETNSRFATIQDFRSPTDIRTFRDIAIGISRQSYKREFGWGFREDESFARQLEIDADACLVRGYVLNLRDEPAGYVFCRIDHDVIIYKHLGHDERYTQYSPGTVLLYLLLERLFEESEFRLLDFDGMEHIPYKEFFATRMLRCGRVMWFPLTVSNTALVGGHWIITAAWRFVTARRDTARRNHDKWVSVRDLSPLWSRILSAPRR
jgi:hypothetical protein